ncbi:uncharacterized protein LOC143539831 [Bidens hawaiensis]|uniref:uncharacterized protein LOC143539831 n=1 Tax=Bidens hawaiensis TaxID=980011 RepID=UPI00404B9F01
MDLILEDKEENRVHASILKKFISCFGKKINEYSCYEISKASFASYSDNFKYVENNHKMLLELLKMMSLFKISQREAENQQKKLPIDLHGSNGSKIGITLWDSYVVNVRSYIENNPKEAPMVVILQFATYKPYGGVPGISNALSITNLLQMIGSETPSNSLLSPLSIRDPYFEEFVNETDFSNVGEVEDIGMPKKVVICGSITQSSNYNSWYYVGCKICTTQLKEENKVSHQGEIVGEKSMNQFKGKYKCLSNKCNGAVVDAVARYRIPFDVQDSTGSLALTLWETQAVPIFKITAMELFKKLVEPSYSNDESVEFPAENLSEKNRISRRAKMDYKRTRFHFTDDDEKYKGVSKDYLKGVWD